MRMLLALDWKTVIYITLILYEFKKWRLCLICITTLKEGLRIPNHNKSVTGSRKQDIKPLRRKHEPNIALFIATRKRYNNDFTLFALVVI